MLKTTPESVLNLIYLLNQALLDRDKYSIKDNRRSQDDSNIEGFWGVVAMTVVVLSSKGT